jgi:hypothetical protein
MKTKRLGGIVPAVMSSSSIGCMWNAPFHRLKGKGASYTAG